MAVEKKYSQLLHKRLKKYRVDCGLKQSQVAEVLGIDRSTYTYYETGRSQPSLDVLGILCHIYNITFNELLGTDESSSLLADPGYEKKAESINHPIDKERLNTLSIDEKDLILRFRLLSDAQKKEFLIAFGIREDIPDSKSN